MPQLWVIAGPNGAGKTTVVSIRLRARIPIINTDDIAKNMQPNGQISSATLIKAGRLSLAQQQTLLAERKSFGLEATFAGKREIILMQAAKQLGYKVNLVYIGIRSASVSCARVLARVSNGGHSVPFSDIHRRYPRSLENLKTGLALADRAYILDNSGKRRRLLLSIDKRGIKFAAQYDKLPEWSKEIIYSRISSQITS